ncbi:MAG: hypothetical protein WBD81_13745 [Collimonas pratensis]|uniref:hypothetical protein n=1 Tax=Collimonas pratensis TaxID=279113 RepID=UPI003C7867CE
MASNQNWTVREGLSAAAAIVFVLVLNGALPFFTTPTLGQAIWTTGFSQSFANGPWYSIFSHDFGFPKPAAIAFGLAGAWPASLLIRLGLHPADAYSGMVAFWLVVGLFSAYQIARKFGARRSLSLLGGMVWMSMPIIWAHAGYSMLSLGMGLLPFYFLAALKLFVMDAENGVTASAIVFYFVAAFISVFMDGYTFMMFATGASILLAVAAFNRPEMRRTLLRTALPVHMISLGLAYLLFSAYVGKTSFGGEPIDFFRGWGLDLSFMAIPTKGMHWIPDLLGFSLTRSDDAYFGDASVWSTTFSLPLILAGIIAWKRNRQQTTLVTAALLIAVFGFYMALGPSLKINSTKPETLQLSHSGQQSALMSADLAIMPTGNAWISEILPGFKVMRASYRWSALGIFAVWLLIMYTMAHGNRREDMLWAGVFSLLVLFNLPNIPERWRNGVATRTMFHQIDHDLVASLHRLIRKDEIVAFLPWGNDFIVNYLAPRAGFRALNIGGDKNLFDAEGKWPPEMAEIGQELDVGDIPAAMKMLFDGTADVLVVPYFNMLWSAHLWPCLDQTTMVLSIEQQDEFHRPGFVCPLQLKAERHSVILALQKLPYLEVIDSGLFAVIRLRPELVGKNNRAALTAAVVGNVQYPIVIGSDLKEGSIILPSGWYRLEPNLVWSQGNSKLVLPVPEECTTRSCAAILKFYVHGASPGRPTAVNFDSVGSSGHWRETMISTSVDGNEMVVPLNNLGGKQEISISIPNATSPQVMTGSLEKRILGIALLRIELIHK